MAERLCVCVCRWTNGGGVFIGVDAAHTLSFKTDVVREPFKLYSSHLCGLSQVMKVC